MTARSRAVAFAPGRVNLIGEHTDYNGGLALPFAIAGGVTAEATAAPGTGAWGAGAVEAAAPGAHAAPGEVVVIARDAGEQDRFPLADPPREGAAGWRAFARGVVAELAAAGLPVAPARLTFASTLPQGAGLSSSAALSAALALALVALSGAQDADRRQLARICSRVEHLWVGAETGLLDQLASLLGVAGHALRIDFRTLAVEPVPLALGGWRLVLVDSRESRNLADSGYNERRAECARAAALLGVETVSEAAADAAARLPAPLHRRVRHVLSENRRVEEAVAALRAGELAAVGPLLDASHASLRDDYAASTHAVEAAVARLREAGAAGARMVGGGFGGHVLGLFPPHVEPPADAVAVEPADGARLVG